MKNTRSRRSVFIVLLLSFFFGCTEDYFEFDKIKTEDWRPQVAIPLINSSLTAEDIIISEDSVGVLTTDPSGLIILIYEGNVASLRAVDIVQLGDQTFRTGVGTTVNERINFPVNGTIQKSYSESVTFTPDGGEEIDRITLKGGEMRLSMASDFQHNADVKLKFPGIISAAGDTLSFDFNFTYNGNLPVVRTGVQDLNGYQIDMTNGGTTINEILTEYDVTINYLAGNPINATDSFKLTFQMLDLQFSDFVGFIGNDTLNLDKDTIEVDLFKNAVVGDFFLNDPKLDITITSSYGLEANMFFNQLLAITTQQGDINMQLPNNPIPLNSPTNIGGSAVTEVVLRNTNSNVAQVVSAFPKRIAYDAVAFTNPSGNTTPRNFVTDSSKIDVELDLELPLSGTAKNFLINDTVEFELDFPGNVDDATVKLNTLNGFPMDVEAQIFFTDADFNPIDSLFESQRMILTSGTIDGNGRVSSATQQQQEVTLDGSRVSRLENSKHIILQATSATINDGNTNIQLFSDYEIFINVGMITTVIVE